MAALIEAGFTAEPTDAPLASVEYYQNFFSSMEEWSLDILANMAGIKTSASKLDAHTVISSLREKGKIN